MAVISEDVSAKERRHFMRALAPLLVIVLGFFYGFSPLVTPIAEHFASGDHGSTDGLKGGLLLYGFAILFLGMDLLGSLWCVTLEGRPLLRRYVVDGTILLFPVSIGLLTLSVHIKSVLLLLGSFAVMSFPVATVGQYFLHAEMPRFWQHRTHVGSALCGFCIGLGGFVWMLTLGELVYATGPERVTTVLALCALVSAVGCALIVCLLKPGAVLPPSTSCKASSSDAVDKQPGRRPFRDLLRNWRLHVYIFAINGFVFCGMSMKMLLSTLFEKVLELSFVDATRMSAFCLLAYLPGRGLAPLFASQDKVFSLFMLVLTLEIAAYALTPWAISLATGSHTKDMAMVVYTALRLVSGGGFAVLLGNISVLGVRIFGHEDFPMVVTYWGLSEWIAGVGPSVAWVLHVQAMKVEGVDSQKSFNNFFFLCAAIAAAAVVSVGLLAWDQKTSQRAARSLPCSATKESGCQDNAVACLSMKENGCQDNVVPCPFTKESGCQDHAVHAGEISI